MLITDKSGNFEAGPAIPSARRGGPIRIVLADGHPLCLRGLQTCFALESDIQVVASCATGEQALEAVRTHRPDVLVLDLRMQGKDGLTLAREIKAMQLPTRVVLFTAALDDGQAIEAVRAGVAGMVLKSMAPEFLVQCIRKVQAGGQWLEHGSLGEALEKMLRREVSGREVAEVLTPREVRIVCMVAAGLRNKEIGDRLAIGEGTVKVHLHNIYSKLQLKGRMALASFAREKDLV
jgi:DNA-binding NarL/FixJ family response regulator